MFTDAHSHRFAAVSDLVSLWCIMLRVLTILLLTATTWTLSQTSGAEETLAEKIARHRAETERKMAEQKRKMNSKKTQRMKSTKRRNSKMYRDYLRSVAESKRKRAAKEKAEQERRNSFRSKITPDEWLVQFVKTTKSAKSFDQLLPFVTKERAESYLRQKASYDPKKAMERRRELQKESGFSPDLIDRMTSHPSKHALLHHKKIAGKITNLKPNSIYVNKDQAKLVVDIRSDAVIDGKSYSKSTASIGLIGQGNTWRFESFKESSLVSR